MMHDAVVAAERARQSTLGKGLHQRERDAIEAFAELQDQIAAQLRPAIAARLTRVQSRRFRSALGRAVAGMGHIATAA